jgi:hypothetical protein
LTSAATTGSGATNVEAGSDVAAFDWRGKNVNDRNAAITQMIIFFISIYY